VANAKFVWKVGLWGRSAHMSTFAAVLCRNNMMVRERESFTDLFDSFFDVILKFIFQFN
jgi:hypothetical protein